jgi:hypothetical protein
MVASRATVAVPNRRRASLAVSFSDPASESVTCVAPVTS